MANEFVVRDGLIISGSWYNSASIFVPNLSDVSPLNYYVTWRQSDGRLEVTPTQGLNLNTQGCWNSSSFYPSLGEYAFSGSNLNLFPYIYISEQDSGGADQTAFLSGLNTGSIVILNIGNQNRRYVVQSGPMYSASLYSFQLGALEDYLTNITQGILCLAFGGTIPGPPPPSYNYYYFTSGSILNETGSGQFFIFDPSTNPSTAVITGTPPYALFNFNTYDAQGNYTAFDFLSFDTPITIIYTDPASGIEYKILCEGYSPNFNVQANITDTVGGVLNMSTPSTPSSGFTIKEGEVFKVSQGWY